jgi:CheY-like chemotaxis protein
MNLCEHSLTGVAKPDKARKSVLCVDNSSEMLEICRRVLEADGYQVFAARNGAEALELLRVHLVEAVVIDDMLPGIAAVALAEKIKFLRNVLVVIYSSESKPGENLPFIDSLLYKGKGPIALRTLLTSLLEK